MAAPVDMGLMELQSYKSDNIERFYAQYYIEVVSLLAFFHIIHIVSCRLFAPIKCTKYR